MNQPRRYQRTTTTQRRRHGTPLRVRPLLFVPLALIAVVIGFGYIVTRSNGASAPLPCTEGSCMSVTTVPDAAAAQGALKAVIPNPYLNQDPDAWMKMTTVAPPQLSGNNAAVVEGSCGKLIYGLRQNDHKPPASIAKIVTAIVVSEQGKMNDMVNVNVNGWDLAVEDGSSVAGLVAGTKVSVQDLLYALILPSGNDAAMALADNFGGNDRFTTLMNGVVKRMGLKDSQFLNPDGRDKEGNYSSAFDMALLGRELMSKPDLKKIAGTQTIPASWDGHTMWNTNYLVYGYKGSTGVKFGYTEGANETVVGSAVRDGRELYASVMDSDYAYLDASKLLDWAFANTKPACA